MILGLLSSLALGGGWTRGQGATYVKVGSDLYQALRFRLPGEAEDSVGDYFAHQHGLYAEVGLSRGHPVQLTVIAPGVVGTHRTRIFDAFGAVPVRATTARLGDLRVALQTALLRDAPLAIAVEAKIPMYRNGAVGNARINFAELFPKPGDGQVDVTAFVFAGASLSERTFVEGGIGYLWRTDAFVGWETDLRYLDGMRGIAKLGHTVGRVLGVLGLEAQLAFAPDDVTRRFVVANVSALIDVGRGVSVEPRLGYELVAQNASQGVGAGLGLSWSGS
ncbi:MAG: hypothetical protein AAF602_16055, partial [Myxococcota bacterium]